MNFLITNQCGAGCRHCMQDSRPNIGQHMPVERVIRAMDWVAGIMAPLNAQEHVVDQIIISGGEPTEHPDFFTILDHACRTFRYVNLCSNGLMLDNAGFRQELMRRVDGTSGSSRPGQLRVQITWDRRFYPKRPNEAWRYENHPSFNHVSEIGYGLSRIGRAIRLLEKDVSGVPERSDFAPPSANMRFRIHDANTKAKSPDSFAEVLREHYRTLAATNALRAADTLRQLESLKKLAGASAAMAKMTAHVSRIEQDLRDRRWHTGFCKPILRYDGQIGLGEWMTCATIGDFEEPDHVLIERARALGSCNRCGLEKNLSRELQRRMYGGDIPMQTQADALRRMLPNGQQAPIHPQQDLSHE